MHSANCDGAGRFIFEAHFIVKPLFLGVRPTDRAATLKHSRNG
jgi:hypothetical protein